MARSFTVTDGDKKTVYEGFDKKFYPGHKVEHVVLILVEGEPEVYVMDDPRKASEFIKYVTEVIEDNVQILGVYTRKS